LSQFKKKMIQEEKKARKTISALKKGKLQLESKLKALRSKEKGKIQKGIQAKLQSKAVKRAEQLRLMMASKNGTKTEKAVAKAAIANAAIQQIYSIVSGKDAAHFSRAINKVVRKTEIQANLFSQKQALKDKERSKKAFAKLQKANAKVANSQLKVATAASAVNQAMATATVARAVSKAENKVAAKAKGKVKGKSFNKKSKRKTKGKTKGKSKGKNKGKNSQIKRLTQKAKKSAHKYKVLKHKESIRKPKQTAPRPPQKSCMACKRSCAADIICKSMCYIKQGDASPCP